MRPDRSGMVSCIYGCDDRECDFGGDARNGVGLAAQHAERTGHETWVEQTISMRWNTDD